MTDNSTRGVLPEDSGGGVRRASGNPYPISDKICDFPYPISDLVPHFRPDANPISFA